MQAVWPLGSSSSGNNIPSQGDAECCFSNMMGQCVNRDLKQGYWEHISVELHAYFSALQRDWRR